MTKASESRRKRRAPKKTAPVEVEGAAPPPEQLSPEETITRLSRQVGYLHQHCAKLVERFVGGEILSQRMTLDQGTQHRAAELQQVAEVLTAIAEGRIQ